MAIAPVIDAKFSLGGTETLYVGTFTPDASWLAAGEAFDVSGNERFDYLLAQPKGGYVFTWDAANQKILAYYADNNNASDGPLIAVPDTTDISAIGAVQFWAIGN